MNVEELQDNPGTPGTNVPYLVRPLSRHTRLLSWLLCMVWQLLQGPDILAATGEKSGFSWVLLCSTQPAIMVPGPAIRDVHEKNEPCRFDYFLCYFKIVLTILNYSLE